MRRPASAPTTSTSSQTYDDYPVINVMQIEDLGFCEKGEGPEFVRRHTFTADGSFPFNTSRRAALRRPGRRGRRFSRPGRGAFARSPGSRSARSVPEARLGLARGFGMINYDRGLCSGAAILAAGNDR